MKHWNWGGPSSGPNWLSWLYHVDCLVLLYSIHVMCYVYLRRVPVRLTLYISSRLMVSSFILVFRWVWLPLSSFEFVFLWVCLPISLSSFECVKSSSSGIYFLSGCLSVSLFSCESVFLWVFLAVPSSFREIVFLKDQGCDGGKLT